MVIKSEKKSVDLRWHAYRPAQGAFLRDTYDKIKGIAQSCALGTTLSITRVYRLSSYMSVHVLLNLFNKFVKSDKM